MGASSDRISSGGASDERAQVTSAIEIADALSRPRPTAEQIAVIEAPLEPALVVAGAGSGKTETMANRVLWLLANRLVRPSEILGLTFTRKAAGELSGRIRTRITQLAEAGLVADDYDAFEAPQVSTYNSFANAIYRDNAMLIGREGDGAILGSASAWQLARSLVTASKDERLVQLDKRVDDVTKAVLALNAAVAENIVDPSEVRTFASAFAALADLPGVGRYAYEDAATLARTIGSLDVVLELAEEFAQAKRRRGFIEFSDQVALALEIVRGSPRIRTEFREQFRVVLLDEYQDTSVVQTWLLSELFGGHPVMAVGDPNQSIYGWRGASAANLESFGDQFAGGNALDFNLSTSWRNGHDILSVANALVEPLVPHTRVRVQRLTPGPRASDRTVDVTFEESVVAEAQSAALWLKKQLATLVDATSDGTESEAPTAAMLFRARKNQSFFLEALREHGIPFHVLGVGGLLATPEIADLVSALTVVSNPTAGNELIRLLAGSRWRIGVRDLRFLRRLASWLNRRDLAQQPLADDVVQRLRDSVAEGEGGSIVDAVDFLATAPIGHSQLTDFSETGLERLREAGRTFAWLRSRAGLDLLDFVTLVEQELRLDIEVVANEFLPLGGANKEAFFDALAGYIAVDDSASLGGFLGWLREAEWRDGLSPRPEDPEPGTVQILTIHGAKGLEWDAVVVPRLVDEELPAKPREGYNGWLAFGQLPWPFRGDKNELPEFIWQGHGNRKELLDARGEFTALVRERHESEERRLAYVAVTRARHALLLSGSYWATQTKPRGPSPFLTELADAGIIGTLPGGTQNEENPLGDEVDIIHWPADPLGGRRRRVEAAAGAVRAAMQADSAQPSTGVWGAELELLLAERAARLDSGRYVALPTRVPASRFKDFVADPVAVASSLRRPMPEKPYRATRLGTLFHSWVEQRGGVGGSVEELDTLATESDAGIDQLDGAQLDAAALAKLQATFEQSPWASLAPIDVEREIHLVLDGQIIICKIDAVYERGGRYQIVDWKTGKAPKDAKDLEEKQLQLALYRLAYARWRGIDPSLIDAVFYFVADDRIITPDHLDDEHELIEKWRRSLG